MILTKTCELHLHQLILQNCSGRMSDVSEAATICFENADAVELICFTQSKTRENTLEFTLHVQKAVIQKRCRYAV